MSMQEVAYDRLAKLIERAEDQQEWTAEEIGSTLRRLAREIEQQQQLFTDGWLGSLSAQGLESATGELARLVNELHTAQRQAGQLKSLIG